MTSLPNLQLPNLQLLPLGIARQQRRNWRAHGRIEHRLHGTLLPLYLNSRVVWRCAMPHAGATGRSYLGPMRPEMSMGRRAPRPTEPVQLPGPAVR